MREEHGDLFTYVADAIVIPTNGMVKHNGELVMGAGVAKTARDRFPGIAAAFGLVVKDAGNIVQAWQLEEGSQSVISFPTKEDWRDPSDKDLIARSRDELLSLVDAEDWKVVAMPRVGCGLGGLKWTDVRMILQPLLDDRFVVLTP